MLNVQIKGKYVAVAVAVLGLVGLYQANKDLDYTFSSVYDNDSNHHYVLVKTDSNNERYNIKCADEVSTNLLKANITNYDISTVNNGEYELIYYNGEKIK